MNRESVYVQYRDNFFTPPFSNCGLAESMDVELRDMEVQLLSVGSVENDHFYTRDATETALQNSKECEKNSAFNLAFFHWLTSKYVIVLHN